MLFFREFEQSRDVRAEATQNGIAGFAAPLVPFLILAAFSVRRRETLLYAFFWLAFVFMYFMLLPGGLVHYWYRYQHIFLPALLVFAAGGLVALLRAPRGRLEIAVLVVFAIPLIGAMFFQYNSFRGHYVRDLNANEGLHVPMAKALRDEVPVGSTIAAHDIGVIGYYSDRKVIDLVGLVNPDVVEYHEDRRVGSYVRRVQPDYLVLFPGWELNFLHIGLDPSIFETVREFPSLGEPYIFYRAHYPAISPSDDRFPEGER
jgi:hypothetical protein